MEKLLASIVIVPGIVALLLFAVFTYLYQQSREAYFRAWQLGWGAYCLYYGLIAFNTYGTISAAERATGNLLLVAMTMCIFVSTRLMRGAYRFRWYDAALGAVLLLLAYLTLQGHLVGGIFQPDAQPTLRLGLGLAIVLLYCSALFYINGHKRGSLAFQVLGLALALWAFKAVR